MFNNDTCNIHQSNAESFDLKRPFSGILIPYLKKYPYRKYTIDILFFCNIISMIEQIYHILKSLILSVVIYT